MQTSPALYVLCGVVLAVLIQQAVPRFFDMFSRRREGKGEVYSLDHGQLNVQMPPPTMWMNMGYWKDTTDFPTACEALLFEVLKKASLIEDIKSDIVKLRPSVTNLSILDLGFGCGEQTMSLMRLARYVPSFKYVGVTLNESQFQYARMRLDDAVKQDESLHDVQLYCGDAANPTSWNTNLLNAARSMSSGASGQETGISQPGNDNGLWVLALDTLYHFKPSRRPLFSFAAKDLKAPLMAFDLMLSDTTTPFQRLLLQLAALVSGCPMDTFATEAQYRAMLLRAGYEPELVEIHDITQHVFGPLSRFVRQRDTHLKAVGLRMGSLKATAKLFGWWARSKVVRGVIVIARK